MRKICLKVHRWLGLAFGGIISIICLTGAVIVFQDDIKEAINADIRHVEDKGERHYLTDEALTDAIRSHAGEDLTLTSLQMPSDANEPAYAQFAERGHQKLAVNPYTGELIGWGLDATAYGRMGRSAGQGHLFPCSHHRSLAPLERLLYVVETDSSS
jgi:uncharacterized iron-regulated membrane protein